MEIKTVARKWGNSLAVILPKSIIEKQKIKENEDIIIDVRKGVITGDFFGKFPRKSNKTAQEIKEEIKRGWK